MTRPPMVGVPDFFIWLCGPSSRMACPKCSRCRIGRTLGMASQTMINATNKLTIEIFKVSIFSLFPLPLILNHF